MSGIELSPQEAQEAERQSGASVFVGDVLDAPYPAESFDVITALHSLEHVYHPREVVDKLWTWLKPGGLLYLQVPNISSVEAALFHSYWYGLELPRHLFHYSPTSLRRLLLGAEFEEVLVTTLPDCFIEKSIRYLVGQTIEAAGGKLTPLAAASETSSVLWRSLRKICRVALFSPFSRLAVAYDRGASIEAIFRKITPAVGLPER